MIKKLSSEEVYSRLSQWFSTFQTFSPVELLFQALEVEQWSDNRTLSISMDQSPLGARSVGDLISWPGVQSLLRGVYVPLS